PPRPRGGWAGAAGPRPPGPPASTNPPRLSGQAQQGKTLTASAGSWTGAPTAFAYQWQRCDSAGANCAAIALATTASYTAVEADVGKTLRVSVTATNEAGPSAPATSSQSAVVKEIPGAPAMDAISAAAHHGNTRTAET